MKHFVLFKNGTNKTSDAKVSFISLSD